MTRTVRPYHWQPAQESGPTAACVRKPLRVWSGPGRLRVGSRPLSPARTAEQRPRPLVGWARPGSPRPGGPARLPGQARAGCQSSLSLMIALPACGGGASPPGDHPARLGRGTRRAWNPWIGRGRPGPPLGPTVAGRCPARSLCLPGLGVSVRPPGCCAPGPGARCCLDSLGPACRGRRRSGLGGPLMSGLSSSGAAGRGEVTRRRQLSLRPLRSDGLRTGSPAGAAATARGRTGPGLQVSPRRPVPR